MSTGTEEGKLDKAVAAKKKEASSDWERHSLLVLQTLKDLKDADKDLNKRIKSLENKVIAVTAVASFLGSLWGFYIAYADVIDRIILMLLHK